jgi:hypothetical protein
MSRSLAALTALVLALVGCGIPTDGEPRPLADETTTTAADPEPDVGDTVARVYLVSDSPLLIPRDRALEGEKTPEAVLDALLLPTSPEEQAADLRSLVPALTTALGVTDEGDGTLAVDLSAEWDTLADPSALYAYGQVVLTLTELSSVERIRFLIEGDPVDAPPTVNQEPSETVEAEDYEPLKAE